MNHSIIHVGHVTDAGSRYNDVAYVETPMGNRLSLPLKYWVTTEDPGTPLIPSRIFKGDIRNTESLQQWMLAIAEEY
jgi:hypothetical protein